MGKRILQLGLHLLVGVLAVAACNFRTVRGSGDVVTETRQVRDFDRIELSGSGEVVVTQGGSESLVIEADDNVMEYLVVEVVNGTLRLGLEEEVNFISAIHLVFFVGVDDLNGLTISGSGDMEADTLETGRLDVNVSGSGKMRIGDLTADEVDAEIIGSGEVDLAGNAAIQVVSIDGSGQYLAGDLCSASVSVNISGSGEATLCATETLASEISGSGSVNYYGRPVLNTAGSGSGQINSLGDK